MAKIIDFIIIVFLIGLIIYLIATMFKAPKQEAPTKQRNAKDDCEILIKTLKMKLKEAQKIKILADADAYEKQRAIQANGALEQKLEAYVKVQEAWAKAASSSNWVPTYQSGGTAPNGGSNVNQMVDMFMFKSAAALNLDVKTK